MQLFTENIKINIDDENGFIREIIAVNDPMEMNWVLENSDWGKLEGFQNKSVEVKKDGVSIHMIKRIEALEAVMEKGKPAELEALIERRVCDGFFEDCYYIKNMSEDDYFITQDTFGICFPFQCLNKKELNDENKVHKACITHIWCGDEICWLYGVKLIGKAPYFMINMQEGLISDYSIRKDVSRSSSGVYYRGKIILNPGRCVLKPGEIKSYRFIYKVTDTHPKEELKREDGFIFASANQYTPSLGEKVIMKAEFHGADVPQVMIDGKKIQTIKCKDSVSWEYIAEELGEKKFDIYAGNKHTFLKIYVIESVEKVLEKRAYFIAEKQQFLREGSKIDGAYLVYDNTEQAMYCDNRFVDNGASRERIGMGLLVARQLQKKKDDQLMQSLERHYQFVQRELFDEESFTVYNRVGRDNSYHRIYNYPWFSLYFLEWFKLERRISDLVNAAKIILKYYELNGDKQDSQCIEAVELIHVLEKNGLMDLRNQVETAFLGHADSIIERGMITSSDESGVMVHEVPNTKACYLAQAYILTGNKKYYREMEKYITVSEAFFSFQPEYHLNEISFRHTDGYWFGKKKQYGDLYPHYWSTLTGWMYYWYEKASGSTEKRYENILRNNLCVYSENGAAANSYLYPYKIELFTSKPEIERLTQPIGKYTGKRYDEWANDQDFGLYYADKLLNER